LLLYLSTGPVPVEVRKGATAEISAGSTGTTDLAGIILVAVKKQFAGYIALA
jgi:hypothetical protein